MPTQNHPSRREFLKNGSLALGGLPLIGRFPATIFNQNTIAMTTVAPDKSLIGQYGPWAASLLPNIPALSFRQERWSNLKKWRKQARERVTDLLASPAIDPAPKPKIEKEYTYDGLTIQQMSWQLPYGRPTEAILLKPADAKGKLPAVLGLHDHSGNKYFGKQKIVRVNDDPHPAMIDLQNLSYEGKAWANELAKRGYVVLVHDVFTFGSRRVHYEDVAGYEYGPLKTDGKPPVDPDNRESIDAYNRWAGEHEHIMAKSLFCAGTTWPGVFFKEDQVALDILSTLDNVDPDRMGCAGLSGGGLRTVFLGGLDERIKCAVAMGFMTTWKDLILHKSYTHTWMTYVPLLPKDLDFPEILGLRAPLPTMVQNNNQDSLFTLSEMKVADEVLRQVFNKAGAADKYSCRFYDGPHKFDREMQEDAFAWMERWL